MSELYLKTQISYIQFIDLIPFKEFLKTELGLFEFEHYNVLDPLTPGKPIKINIYLREDYTIKQTDYLFLIDGLLADFMGYPFYIMDEKRGIAFLGKLGSNAISNLISYFKK